MVSIARSPGGFEEYPQQTIFVMSRKWSSKGRASGTSRSLKLLTAQADLEFDEHGKVIKKPKGGNDLGLEDMIVVERETTAAQPTGSHTALEPCGEASTQLFDDTAEGRRKRTRASR